jgi:hypothetical protein
MDADVEKRWNTHIEDGKRFEMGWSVKVELKETVGFILPFRHPARRSPALRHAVIVKYDPEGLSQRDPNRRSRLLELRLARCQVPGSGLHPVGKAYRNRCSSTSAGAQKLPSYRLT